MNKMLKKISIVMLALVLTITLASCGGNSAVEKDIKDEVSVMQKTFVELGDALKKGDTSQIANVPQFAAVADQFKDNPEALKSLGNIATLMSETEISVSNVKESGDKATAKLKVKGYDLAGAMQKASVDLQKEAVELASQGKSQEEMTKILLVKVFEITEKNAKADGKNSEKEIDAELIKKSGKWVFSPTTMNEISRVLSGGF